MFADSVIKREKKEKKKRDIATVIVLKKCRKKIDEKKSDKIISYQHKLQRRRAYFSM